MSEGTRLSKKKKKWRRIYVWIPILFVVIVGLAFSYLYAKGTAYKSVPLDLSDEELGIMPDHITIVDNPEKVEKKNEWDNKVFNIALFGIDRRDSEETTSRSDSMIIATLDFKHGKVKLTSLMRDQLVKIEGHGEDKLNHAYAFGEAPLAIKTINQNFGTDIRNYATVDFEMLMEIIDILGGVEIDLNAGEVKELNEYLSFYEDAKLIGKEGVTMLDGELAVAYSRIRYVGDGDFERTERQRRVLYAMVEKAKKIGPYGMTKLWFSIAPHVETSLDNETILSLGKTYFATKNMKWEQVRFPLDGTWSSGRLQNGAWVMFVDMEKQKKAIQDYLYEDIKPSSQLSTLESERHKPRLFEKLMSK